jgi:hypothetical protein
MTVNDFIDIHRVKVAEIAGEIPGTYWTGTACFKKYAC